jgi:hypothetical protein
VESWPDAEYHRRGPGRDHEVIALHGHVVGGRDWDRLGEVVADDVVFDLTDYGYGTLHGMQAMQDLVRGNRDDAAQPLGHQAAVDRCSGARRLM